MSKRLLIEMTAEVEVADEIYERLETGDEKTFELFERKIADGTCKLGDVNVRDIISVIR